MSTYAVSKLTRVNYGLAELARFFPDQVYFAIFILNLKQIGYSGF